MNQKVSIITPTYNSERFIKATIQSVLSQTYTNWELLIIDDASTDGTLEIINGFISKQKNINVLQNQVNQGAAVSRNLGIKKASGDFIAFLDSDDLWKPSKLEKQVEFMIKHNIDVCFSSYDLMDENGKLLYKTVKALPKLTYKKFLKCNYIGNLTGMYNAGTLGKVYSPNLLKRQDWLIWLKAVEKSKKPTMGIEEPLAIYRVRKKSISSNKINMLKYNYLVYRKGLGFSVPKSISSLMVFLYEYFFVKSKQTVTSQMK
ncbi:glycosyltransferase family 2 protein [Hyunsoonleella flava]|uniref:Glycosyltransferase family 2 protein n=1 Tax=Hyunsoonleella flava TaxID=2527939 RepID=A0A4Q9FAP2_9FLAO|nr:glycosyltransferase family 2 protein [Hyunsoonleella flava]TBN00175.1 glycosyltransferase family 2 protein [Hyunsoonleella flava]